MTFVILLVFQLCTIGVFCSCTFLVRLILCCLALASLLDMCVQLQISRALVCFNRIDLDTLKF